MQYLLKLQVYILKLLLYMKTQISKEKYQKTTLYAYKAGCFYSSCILDLLTAALY